MHIDRGDWRLKLRLFYVGHKSFRPLRSLNPTVNPAKVGYVSSVGFLLVSLSKQPRYPSKTEIKPRAARAGCLHLLCQWDCGLGLRLELALECKRRDLREGGRMLSSLEKRKTCKPWAGDL